MDTDSEDSPYRLEELVYSDVMDMIRQSDAPESRKRAWQDEAMALLVEAQEAAASEAFDSSTFFERAVAIEESARSFSMN